jgi:hypothetical protein
VNPNDIYKTKNVNEKESFNLFGFVHPVHTRHYSLLGASYYMKGIIVYVLGEGGFIRGFEKGKLIFSSLEGEPIVNKPELKKKE